MKRTEKDLTTLIGQRICVGFTGEKVTEELRDLIQRYKVGNILLFSRNVRSFDQLSALCAELRSLILSETGLPPLIMIDEEGGAVSRLGHLAGETPSAGALGAAGNPEDARCIGRIIGKRLRAAGINMNLAPVLDCLTQPANAVMGNRCFSPEPAQVARFGRAYIEGIRESGVLTCGKHFPGHGDTAVDSHFGLPVVDKSLAALEKTELVSFREAIRAGTDAIMSAHIVFPALESDGLPATVSSRVLRGLLREKLGFGGLIVSDGMEMQAILDLFPLPEGVLRALKAGVDLALVCHEPAQAAASCRLAAEAAEAGELSRENLEEAWQRIAAAKEHLPSPGPAEDFLNPSYQSRAEEIMARAVQVVHCPGGRPLPRPGSGTRFFSRPSRRASPAMDGHFLNAADYCREHAPVSGSDPASPVETAVFFLSKGPELSEDQREAARLAEAGVQVICAALDVPPVLEGAPEKAWHIQAWQYQEIALRAVLNLLFPPKDPS